MDSAPRILIVDDNPAIHEDFRKILQSGQSRNVALEAVEAVLFERSAPPVHASSFHLDFASQGKEALGKVVAAVEGGHPYALAFVDIRMPPGWDGIVTIEHLWQADPSLQVVICTAYSDYSWEKMTQRLGINDNLVILKKPFDNVEVLQLAHALTKKWLMTQRAQLRVEQLDAMVAERTAELRKSEERFSTAFRASPVALAIQALEDSRFIDANDAFLKLVASSRNQIIDRTPVELRLLIEVENDGSATAADRPAKLSIRGEEPKDVVISRERIHVGGEPHILLLVQDVSERLRLESQLRQAQKMEAVGQLAAGVAHDFNNLLTIIEGHASLQLTMGTLTPEVAQSMGEIEHAAERAADLTRQLLAFSRQQIIRPRVLDLNAVLTGLHGMLARILGERVAVQCDFAPELPPIFADQTSVEQVVMNLVLNARDAMPEGGQITLRTARCRRETDEVIWPDDAKRQEYLCFTVRDTGTGMDETTRSRIFEPFFTTKEVHKGTGMGLATVYGIVRQHEGWVNVVTAPGQGSTFRVYFPISHDPVTPGKTPSSPAATGQNQTVFVVEDDTAVRSLVKEMLESYDYRVIEAESGDAALALWPSIRDEVRLLLTDMVMPGEHNGLQLSRKLLADKPELKVIYTSGYSTDLFSSDLELVEGCNYLPKPYLISKLVAIVAHAFEAEPK